MPCWRKAWFARATRWNCWTSSPNQHPPFHACQILNSPISGQPPIVAAISAPFSFSTSYFSQSSSLTNSIPETTF